MSVVLSVKDARKVYGGGCHQCDGLTGPASGTNRCTACGSVVAVAGVSLELHRGEILGVMGESGSGKSSLVRLINMDEPATSGSALFHHEGRVRDLFQLDAAQARRVRSRHLGVVYQNPHLGLNFRFTAGGNIAERLLAADYSDYAGIRKRALHLLDRTGLPEARMDEMPGGFSGGMQQRVQIAKALATNPPLLLLDEITTGLDVSVQARILDLILELQEELRLSMIVVTHDLGVVRLLAGRTLVMRHGRVVESGLTDQVLEDPQHPYTQTLVSSAL
jgi:putative phosphonate transport system ATP-binding protein